MFILKICVPKIRENPVKSVVAISVSSCLLRTSWVYTLRTSAGSTRRKCFLTQVLHWARTRSPARPGAVPWPKLLPRFWRKGTKIQANGSKNEPGYTTHLAGKCAASRYEWAQAILDYDSHKAEQIVERVLTVKTSEFPAPVQRPTYSALAVCRRATRFPNLSLFFELKWGDSPNFWPKSASK